MSGDTQPSGPTAAPGGPLLQTVLPMALGIAVGRLAGDAVRESVGWWGSIGVGTLAAIPAALTVYFVVLAVRRRR